MAEATDPFYPYFPCLKFPRVSTAGESRANEKKIPYWRALLPSKSGLHYSLQKLPPDEVEELWSNYKKGKADLAQGKWQTAEERFLRCKHVLLAYEADLEQLLGKQAYDFVVAWAVLPLAHVYQSQFESTDMLKQAVEVREEVLRRVSPSSGSHLELVRVCESYCHTARYEWGKASSSEADVAGAVRDYATLEMCSEDEAHAQLCFLLGIDHKYSGCFLDHELEASLRWIQEANRVWRKNAGDENKFYYYNLDFEAQLLMVRGKFSEAEEVLENIIATREESTRIEYISHPDHAGSGLNVQEMLRECRSQRGSSDLASEGITQEASRGRQGHYFLRDEDWETRNAVGSHFRIPASHPILRRTPPSLGSSLGLRKATDDMLAHEVRKLPRQIRDILHWFSTRNDSYDETHGFEQLREFLLSAKGFLDGKTYDWFLSYYDLSLAEIYLYCIGKPEEALELWTELMNCVRSQLPHQSMAKGYDMICNAVSVLVEYEINGTASFGTPLDSNSMGYSWSKIDEMNESYFWLYFGNWNKGKLEDALKWLRKVKWQRGMSFGDVDHSPSSESKFGYICCDYEYLLCEVDLLMRLGKFEEAIPRLKELLITEQVQQGPRRLARQAKQWFNFCSFFHAGTSPVGIEPEDAADLPPPSACSADNSLNGCGLPCAKLVQAQTGLEYHLQMLPVPYRLAVRYHGNLGTSYFNDGKWEKAIFELEWCRELLSLLHQWLSPGMPPIVERACSWLSVWVAVPLAEIYHIRKLDFKAAFDLQLEVYDKTVAFKENSEKALIEITSLTWTGAVLHQYAESSNDSILKHISFKHLEKLTEIGYILWQFGESRNDSSIKNTILQLLEKGYIFSKEFSIEFFQLSINFIHYFTHSEYVIALKIAQQLQRLFEERHSQHEDFLIAKSNFVVFEAECFLRLLKLSEAKAVLDSYHLRTGLSLNELPELVQDAYLDVAIAARGADPDTRIFLDSARHVDTPFLTPTRLLTGVSPEILELERTMLEFARNEEFAKAAELSKKLLHKTCDTEYYYSIALCNHCNLYSLKLLSDLLQSDCEFSFDELNAISEGETVKSLLGCLVELIEHPSTTLESRPYSYTLLVMHQVLLANRYYEYFRSTWAPLTRFIHAGAEELEDDIHRQLQILRSEVVSHLRKENSVERYSNEAIEQFEVVLESAARSKQYSESWIELLQTHKPIYHFLQHYNLIRAQEFEFLILYDIHVVKDESTSSSGKILDRASVEWHKWNAFFNAEAERTRVMLYQLGFQKPNFNSRWEFTENDLRNMGIIQHECGNILEEGSVFVEYSFSTIDENYIIYVVHQDGAIQVHFTRLVVKIKGGRFEYRTRDRRTFERVIKDLYNYFEPSTRRSKCTTNYNAATLNEDLEYLYQVLIKPIAKELAQMKPEHKLIFSVNELLTKVPFAALRNREDQTYLIEHHTIAISPSLKVLQFCQQRLTELRRSPLKKRGSIVALGDPKYDCVRCKKGRRKDLKWTRDEVEHIAELFGDAAVVKLLQGDATAEQLRLWTSERPDGQSFRQAIVHIGAHGVIDETKDRYMESSVIQLACPPCSMDADVSSSSSTNTTSVSVAGGQAAKNALRNEVEHGDEDVLRESFDDVDDIDEQDESDEIESGGLHESMKMMFGVMQRASEGASSSGSALVGRGDAGFPTRNETCHDLTIKDLLVDMQMRVELVVLSACRTSRGRTTIEGVLSLARAFMIAGVPSIVASLWNVDDEATCALMKVFYDELRRGKDVASALRSSMLERMNVSPSHRDAVREWAPFNVWGVPSLRLPTELLQNFDKECQ